MHISRIQRLSIAVSDQERAKAFYVETLGLDLLGDFPVPMGQHARWIEVAPRGAATSIVLQTWLPNMTPGGASGVMLETGDLDADCGRLRAADVAVQGPFETPWGRQATFSDPDGNGFVLAARRDAQV